MLTTMNSNRTPNAGEGKVLSFLKKNSKIKTSKLKCAARTQIDLKALDCNPTNGDCSFINESLIFQNQLNLTGNFDTLNENHLTEPLEYRAGCFAYRCVSPKCSSSFANQEGQRSQSSSPTAGLGRGYNLNKMRSKTNQEAIVKNIVNVKRSFREMLDSKSPVRDDKKVDDSVIYKEKNNG